MDIGRSRAKSAPNLIEFDQPVIVTDCKSNIHQFTLIQILGKGGFADCYMAKNKYGQNFALKVIPRRFNDNKTYLKKIRNEILIHSTLRHPHIVTLYWTFEDLSRNIYMVLELCSQTLATFIENQLDKRITEVESVNFLWQLLTAINYLHNECRILHRDIKPGNILLTRDRAIKLADFGFSCYIREIERRSYHSVCGTPNYLAPEVIENYGHSVYSESWSIACTFYCMLFGTPPFYGRNHKSTYESIRQCKYSFPGRVFVSSKAKEFIRRSIIYAPEFRIKVHDMLSHSLFSASVRTHLLNRSISYSSGMNSPSLLQKRASPMRKSPINNFPSPKRLSSKASNYSPATNDSGFGGDYSNSCTRMAFSLLDQYADFCYCLIEKADLHEKIAIRPVLPDSFVVKWVDYTNKFGFAVTLKDGTRAVLYNDKTSLSTQTSQYGELYSYRPNMLLDEYNEWVTDTGCSYSTQQRSKDVNEKISTIHFLKEYMDNELYSAIKCSNGNDPDFLGRKLSGYTESDDSCEDSTHPSRRSSNAPSLTHILDFQRFDDALLIFLSDGTCQINFIRTHYKLAANLASESNSYRNWTKYQLHIVDSEQNLFSFESPSQSNRRIKPPTLFEEDLAHIYDFSNILQSYKDLLQSPRTVVAHCTQC